MRLLNSDGSEAEMCGNALRCAGFYQALRNGAQGKSCVFAEISGADGVQPVMADTAEGTASTVMPLPLSVQSAGWADVQAERVTLRNNPNIRPAASYDINLSPYSADKKVINYIEDVSYKSPGDVLTYRFEVELSLIHI